MLPQTLIISLFQPTSSMQSVLTSRILAISLVGLLLYISDDHCLSFNVLKYISFCCHFSHAVGCCNRLVYSCCILFVKIDSNFNLNSSCQLFRSFHICLSPLFVYRLFLSFYLLIFLFYIFSLCHSVSLTTPSFFLSFCLFSSFCRTSSLLFFFHFQTSFLPFRLFIF